MEHHKLSEMTKGWFVGDFEPSLLKTKAFEIAVKRYKKGDKEGRHRHDIASEYTVIVSGRVRMSGTEYAADSILIIKPGEATDFEALEDSITVVVKTPSARTDKYEVLND